MCFWKKKPQKILGSERLSRIKVILNDKFTLQVLSCGIKIQKTIFKPAYTFFCVCAGALVNSDLYPEVGELWEKQFVQTIDSLR